MGCWNGTCGISNLPIKHGDKIKVVVIHNNVLPGSASGFCYETGMAKPMSFIFEGTYNDYGMIEDIEDSPNNKLFEDLFNSELEKGNIAIGDRADCEPDSLINILELIEREQITMKKSYWAGEGMDNDFTELGIMMFHTSIINDLTQTLYESNDYWFEDYSEKTLTTMAIEAIKNSNKVEIKLLIRSLNEELEDETDPGEKILIEKEIDEAYVKLFADKDLSENYENKFRSLVNNDAGNSIVFRIFIEEIKNFSSEDKKKSVRMLIDMLNLTNVISSLRKHWGPCSGKGSQSEDYSFYRTLTESMKDIMNKDFEDEYNGQELECIKSFKLFKAKEYYIIDNMVNGEAFFQGKSISVTYNELESNFEY